MAPLVEYYGVLAAAALKKNIHQQTKLLIQRKHDYTFDMMFLCPPPLLFFGEPQNIFKCSVNVMVSVLHQHFNMVSLFARGILQLITVNNKSKFFTRSGREITTFFQEK